MRHERQGKSDKSNAYSAAGNLNVAAEEKEPTSWIVDSVDLPALQELAESLVRTMPKRLVLGLIGTLGAGKTTLVQAIARAAEIDASEVTSPTFTLLQTHRGSFTLNHLDAYRVADEDEFLELGVEELFDDASDQPTAAWTVVEWADRFADCLPANTLWIRIDLESVELSVSDCDVDDQQPVAAHPTRTLTLWCGDPRIAGLLPRVVRDWKPFVSGDPSDRSAGGATP
jgi:tRNA threonylcarbamoyladenosine biosynthesis protein TsaE